MGLGEMPTLDGFVHRWIDVGDGVTIHVADAGPPDSAVGNACSWFPQKWWLWYQLIRPLTADGFQVLAQIRAVPVGARRPAGGATSQKWQTISRPCSEGLTRERCISSPTIGGDPSPSS